MSRTDSIGDVVLTLPMAGFIKKHFPQFKILFLGRTYTKDVVLLSQFVDEFINYDEFEKLDFPHQKKYLSNYLINTFVHVFPNKSVARLAKLLKIETRVGTTNRIYHWFTCNKLIRLSRKNSNWHEAQLNLKLLSFLKANTDVEINNLIPFYGFKKVQNLKFDILEWIDPSKIKVILHPKSKGSAKEWGLNNFTELINLLPENKFQIFISGTNEDEEKMKDFIKLNPKAINITGQLTLSQFIVFIQHCDALVAASTGPLHIAAALGKKSIGLFTSKRPMHPGRWAPIGKQAKVLVYDKNCQLCMAQKDCNCIQNIQAQTVFNLLNEI